MVSPALKKLLTLRVAHLIVKHFQKAQCALTAPQISHELEIPIRLARQIVYDLTEVKILSATKEDDEKAAGYQPAHDISDLTIKDIIDAFEHEGCEDIPVAQTAELKKLSQSLDDFNNLIKKSPANMKLKDV